MIIRNTDIYMGTILIVVPTLVQQLFFAYSESMLFSHDSHVMAGRSYLPSEDSRSGGVTAFVGAPSLCCMW